MLDAALSVKLHCLSSVWCVAPFDCWVSSCQNQYMRLPACATGSIYPPIMPVQDPRTVAKLFLSPLSRNDTPVWLHTWIHVSVPGVSGKGNPHVEGNGLLFLHTAPLPNPFFRPSQWDSLLALAVFFMPVITSNIGYANCTVSHCSLVDLRYTSGSRCKVQ